MNSGFKKRPEANSIPNQVEDVELSAFVEGTVNAPAVEPPYPWQAPHVRADVTRVFNLRLSEPDYLKLKYLAEEGGAARSMHQFIIKALRPAIDQAISNLTRKDAGR